MARACDGERSGAGCAVAPRRPCRPDQRLRPRRHRRARPVGVGGARRGRAAPRRGARAGRGPGVGGRLADARGPARRRAGPVRCRARSALGVRPRGARGRCWASVTDGDVALIAPDGTVSWQPDAPATAGSRLVLQDDGDLVVARPAGCAGLGVRHRRAAVDPPARAACSRRATPCPRPTAGRPSSCSTTATSPCSARTRRRAGPPAPTQPGADPDPARGRQPRRHRRRTATGRGAAGPPGNPGASLVLQDDGDLVLYDAAGAPVWSTGTVVGPPSLAAGTPARGRPAAELPGRAPAPAARCRRAHPGLRRHGRVDGTGGRCGRRSPCRTTGTWWSPARTARSCGPAPRRATRVRRSSSRRVRCCCARRRARSCGASTSRSS